MADGSSRWHLRLGGINFLSGSFSWEDRVSVCKSLLLSFLGYGLEHSRESPFVLIMLRWGAAQNRRKGGRASHRIAFRESHEENRGERKPKGDIFSSHSQNHCQICELGYEVMESSRLPWGPIEWWQLLHFRLDRSWCWPVPAGVVAIMHTAWW
jgi:hypothetical protein